MKFNEGTQQRLQRVLANIQRIAAGDFAIEEPLVEHGDELDAVAVGLVMLAQEISGALECSEGTARNILFRSLRKLRTLCAESEGVHP